MPGITHSTLEINHSIEGTAGADPLIHSLTHGLALRMEVLCALVRRECSAVNPQPTSVGASDELLVRGLDIGRGERARITFRIKRPTDIVDPFEQNDGTRAGRAPAQCAGVG